MDSCNIWGPPYLVAGAGKACASHIKASAPPFLELCLFQPSPDTFGAVRPVGSSLTIPIFHYNSSYQIFNWIFLGIAWMFYQGIEFLLFQIFYLKISSLLSYRKCGAGKPCPGHKSTASVLNWTSFPSKRSLETRGMMLPCGSNKNHLFRD